MALKNEDQLALKDLNVDEELGLAGYGDAPALGSGIDDDIDVESSDGAVGSGESDSSKGMHGNRRVVKVTQ